MAALPHGMEHISRKDLYTSLPIRIQYLHQYLEFGPDDLAALVDGQPYIKAAIPDVSSAVYKKLLRHDITARVFSVRDSRIEEDPEIWPSDESSAISTRKIFLKWYLTRLISDPTDIKYWEYLDKIGSMHSGFGRRDPINIDYTFLGLMLGYVQTLVIDAIMSQTELSLKRKTAIMKAFSKVIWIQNDLFARYKTRDSDDIEGANAEMTSHTEPLSSPGGIQDCKFFNNPGPSFDTDSTTSGSSGKTSLGRSRDDALHRVNTTETRCPFTGVVLDDQRATLPRAPSSSIFTLQRPLAKGSASSHGHEGKPLGKGRPEIRMRN